MNYAVPAVEGKRKGIKKVMSAMTFSMGPLGRFPKDTRSLFPKTVQRIEEVTEAIGDRHAGIRHLFGRGIGHRVQHIESQIMVDLLLTLKDRGIVALPIHDAVLVASPRSQEATEVLLEVFQRHAGVAGSVSQEEAT